MTTPDTQHELRRELAVERAAHRQTKAQLDQTLARLQQANAKILALAKLLSDDPATHPFRDPYAADERRTSP